MEMLILLVLTGLIILSPFIASQVIKHGELKEYEQNAEKYDKLEKIFPEIVLGMSPSVVFDVLKNCEDISTPLLILEEKLEDGTVRKKYIVQPYWTNNISIFITFEGDKLVKKEQQGVE